ncbi:MAG: site-specific integrase [Proteobacteria bacterium]|nr:site-specific integrase [Pseudomonadota bacterium]
MPGIIDSQNGNDLLSDASEASTTTSDGTSESSPILTSENGTLSPLRPENSGSEALAIQNDDEHTSLDALHDLVDAAKSFAVDAKAAATRKAYAGDWARFKDWCRESGAEPLPARPEIIAAYVAHLAQIGRKPATIGRVLVSISQAHKLAGITPSPTSSAAVQETLKGVRRSLGVAQRQVSPLVVEHLRRLVAESPSSLIGFRDRALLLVGFATAMRRSELVSLTVADLEDVPEGLVVHLRKSKTDQEGVGRRVGVPFGQQPETCPVRALRAWLEAAAITDGALFRAVDRHGRIGTTALSDKAVAEVVKRATTRAGYDAKQFAGHSLRSGFCTAAAAAGKSERAIMAQTGHRSERMVRKYVRDGRLFVENAAEGLL